MSVLLRIGFCVLGKGSTTKVHITVPPILPLTLVFFKNNLLGVVCMSIICAFRKHRQVDLFESEARSCVNTPY